MTEQERIAQLEAAIKILDAALRETRDHLNKAMACVPGGSRVGNLDPMPPIALQE